MYMMPLSFTLWRYLPTGQELRQVRDKVASSNNLLIRQKSRNSLQDRSIRGECIIETGCVQQLDVATCVCEYSRRLHLRGAGEQAGTDCESRITDHVYELHVALV